MNLISVILAQSVKAVRTIGLNAFGYLPEAGKLLAQRYQFVGVPSAPNEILVSDPNHGFTFRHGKFETNDRTIVIEYLQLFSAGVLVTTRTNTQDSDVVIGDVLKWASEQFKVEFEEMKPATAHLSQLEVRFDRTLPSLFPAFNGLGNTISKALDIFWGFRPSYELGGITFVFDTQKFPSIAPSVFKIERRTGVPFEQNIYYSEGSVSTDDHITILSHLEKLGT